MPLAIDYEIWIALSRIPEPEVRIHSIDFDQSIVMPINNALTKGEGWSEYLKGLINIFKHSKFEIFGWKGVMAGNVPIGAGLSSSAAVSLALTKAFGTVCNWDWNPSQMARICSSCLKYFAASNLSVNYIQVGFPILFLKK